MSKQVSFNLAQKKKMVMFDKAAILDTGSTFSSIKDKELLVNVRDAEVPIKMTTNVGDRVIN